MSPNLEFKDKNGEVRMRIGVDADGEPYIYMRDSKSQYESAFRSYEALFLYKDKAGKILRYSDIDFFTFDFVDQERGTSTQLRSVSSGADASYYLVLKDKKKTAKLTTEKLEFKP